MKLNRETYIGLAVGGIMGGFWRGEIAEGWADKVLNKADY